MKLMKCSVHIHFMLSHEMFFAFWKMPYNPSLPPAPFSSPSHLMSPSLYSSLLLFLSLFTPRLCAHRFGRVVGSKVSCQHRQPVVTRQAPVQAPEGRGSGRKQTGGAEVKGRQLSEIGRASCRESV